MQSTEYAHLAIDDGGTLRVRETNHKVVLLIGAHLAYDYDAALLAEGFPPLTLGQAHSILAYYYDHKDAVDRELAARKDQADAILAECGTPVDVPSLRERFRRTAGTSP